MMKMQYPGKVLISDSVSCMHDPKILLRNSICCHTRSHYFI